MFLIQITQKFPHSDTETDAFLFEEVMVRMLGDDAETLWS